MALPRKSHANIEMAALPHHTFDFTFKVTQNICILVSSSIKLPSVMFSQKENQPQWQSNQYNF